MNINQYINEAEERFSGFDGYETYDDFTANDLDFDGNYEGYSRAQGAQQAMSPTPYQLSIVNSTAGTLNAAIFGRNLYLLATNFGSPTGIAITPSQTNVSYVEVLQQSAEQPFETSLIRVQSTNTSQVTQVMTVTSKDANGQQCNIPIITQSYFSANQFQNTIVDIPFNLRIDANTYITYPVLATTTVVITFFPKDKWNSSRMLGNKTGIKQYGAPAVAIGIPTVPVRPAIANRPVVGR